MSLGVNLALVWRKNWSPAALDLIRGLARGAALDARDGKPLWTFRRVGANGNVWFVFNVHDQAGTITLPKDPLQVWIDDGATLAGRTLSLPAGGTWVAQM